MPTTTYRTVNGRILSQNKGGTYSRLMLDLLGSVIGTVNSGGTVSNRTVYWPYGEVRTGGVSSVTVFGFCGGWGYYTDSSGSLYVRARYYRPNQTRWQTKDPLWQDESGYLYTGGDPINFLDYTGKRPNFIRQVLQYVKDLGNIYYNGPEGLADAGPVKIEHGFVTSPILLVPCLQQLPPYPVYGGYCGPQGPTPGPKPMPIDNLDSCRKEHDDCWAAQKPKCTFFNQVHRPECKACTVALCVCMNRILCFTIECERARNTFRNVYCRLPFI